MLPKHFPSFILSKKENQSYINANDGKVKGETNVSLVSNVILLGTMKLVTILMAE